MTKVCAWVVGLALFAVLLPGVAQEESKTVEDEILRDAAEIRLNLTAYQCDLAGLIEFYEYRCATLLPIVSPGMGPRYPTLTDHAGLICFDPAVFPNGFLKGLEGDEGTARNGVMIYRVRIREGLRGNRRVRVVEAEASGRSLAVVPTPDDYDPASYAREVFEHLPPDQQTKAEFERLCRQHDPARIEITVDLLSMDGLDAYAVRAAVESVMRAQQAGGGGGMAMMMGQAGVSNLGFVAIGVVGPQEGPKNLSMTIGWPTNGLSTNGVDFFVCTNLVDPTWSIALTTNVDLNTNRFSWIDKDATNYAVRYYDCWTLDDFDEDLLSNGREVRLWGTTTNDWDTDDDGLGDGYEIAEGMDPLDADEDDDLIVDGDEIKWFGDLSESPDVVVTNGATTIQSAIDSASGGDIVLVLPGTYTGSGNRNLDFGGKDIFLLGRYGAEDTVIDVDGSGRGFHFHSGETRNAKVVGFTVAGGATNDGAGIYCVTSSPTIAECVVASNSASASGGGVCARGAGPVIQDCTISANFAGSFGGGIHLSQFTRIEGTFPDYDLYSLGGDMVVRRCAITGNSSENGAGVFAASLNRSVWGDYEDWDLSSIVIDGCQIACNVAEHGGGALLQSELTAYISNTVVRANQATGALTNNCAHYTGATYDIWYYYSGPGIKVAEADATIRNCTIVGNSSPWNDVEVGSAVHSVLGSGILSIPSSSDSLDAVGTIAYGNTPAHHQVFKITPDGDFGVSYCDYENNFQEPEGPDLPHNLTLGAGNITTPPRLTTDGHLFPGSPCINAATATGAPEHDLDGEMRGASVDIGADEFLDVDGDSLPDWWERKYFVNSTAATVSEDSDDDGLVNSNEYAVSTDPMGGWHDADGDVLSDDRETWLGTDPEYWDSDGDGMGDGWEDAYGFDPAFPSARATKAISSPCPTTTMTATTPRRCPARGSSWTIPARKTPPAACLAGTTRTASSTQDSAPSRSRR